jgi:hypothetical protein
MSQTSFCTACGRKPVWRQASVTRPYKPGFGMIAALFNPVRGKVFSEVHVSEA